MRPASAGLAAAMQVIVNNNLSDPDLAAKIDEHDQNDPLHTLNYILSASQTSSRLGARRSFRIADTLSLPYDNWMLSESRYFQKTPILNPAHKRLLHLTDSEYPPFIPPPTDREIAEALRDIRTIFTISYDEPMVALNDQKKAIHTLKVEGAIMKGFTVGGSGAPFYQENVERLVPILTGE